MAGSWSAWASPAAASCTGSIDLVCCVAGRWWVIDWKSNWIGERNPDGQPGACGPAHYGQAAMVSQMVHHHYPLQAHLYLVALHRYLRWRLADYDPPPTWAATPTSSCAAWPAPTAADPVPGCLVESPPWAGCWPWIPCCAGGCHESNPMSATNRREPGRKGRPASGGQRANPAPSTRQPSLFEQADPVNSSQSTAPGPRGRLSQPLGQPLQ
jgi:hypothetical protein